MNIANPNETKNSTSNILEKIDIRITPDDMEVYLSLAPLKDDGAYSKELILEKLKQQNVVYGINEDAIQGMIDNNLYCTQIQVAQGDRAQDGIDGSYRFNFNTHKDDKPILLEDGSVDYSCLSKIETVNSGDKIAEYSPAIKGINGRNVKGQEVFAKNGRELMPLKGKGFTVSEDKRTYIANIDGKVDYVNGTLEVSNVLILKSDIDSILGNAYFNGHIIVKGSILTGVKVEATGNLTVEGHVEASTLISGGDVVLKNGMQGGGRGAVYANGNVLGKFFEQVTIQAGGSVYANTIMHCNITSRDEVVVSGKRGTIVGGSVSANRSITATVIGSMAEVVTEINVGRQEDVMPGILKKEEDIKERIEEIKKIEEAIRLIDQRLEKEDSKPLQSQKMLLFRAKVEKNAQINTLISERDSLIGQMDHSSNAQIIVNKFIYPNVRIKINGSRLVIKEEQSNVIIKRKGLDVCLFPNE
ncbi:MAG TPA: FapA family protein [Lachnospiraceae bacterium]|nr:FapA family protein [Lachnospiraceae bacterium]